MFSRCRWRVSAGSLDLNAHRYLAEACLAAGQVDATRREADRYRVLIEAAKKQRALRFATPQRRTPKDQLPTPKTGRKSYIGELFVLPRSRGDARGEKRHAKIAEGREHRGEGRTGDRASRG